MNYTKLYNGNITIIITKTATPVQYVSQC